MSPYLLLMLANTITPAKIISPIPAELVAQPAPLSVRLINDSDVPILAVVTVWRVVQPNGFPLYPFSINQDFYEDSPQIDPHSVGTASYRGLERIADLTRPATVEVTVLYFDGRVSGPNTFGIDAYMRAKWDARRQMAKELLQFKGKEEQAKTWLAARESSIPEDSLQASTWQCYLHRRGIMRGWSRLYSAMLNEDIPEAWKQIEKDAKQK